MDNHHALSITSTATASGTSTRVSLGTEPRSAAPSHVDRAPDHVSISRGTRDPFFQVVEPGRDQVTNVRVWGEDATLQHVLRLMAQGPDEARKGLLFHGTGEPIEGPMREGVDGLFWTSASPAVSQTYIPASGSTLCFGKPVECRDNIWAPRTDTDVMLQRAAGWQPSITMDAYNRLQSFRYPPGVRTPLIGDQIDFIEKTLGYSAAGKGYYQIRMKSVNGGPNGDPELAPNGWLMPGTLVILPRPSSLRLLDLRDQLGECDSFNRPYNEIDIFAKARERYDGVIIHDQCQTENHGNVGHVSIGLFPHAIATLPHLRVPAVHHEWPMNDEPWTNLTPQFEQACHEARFGQNAPKP